ncbi:MAG TPA: hypothetical protein VF911_11465 [Thermoanaerobaculia bacterium]|jgi:hypothetical protein
MNKKLTTLALAGTLIAAATASAYPVQQNLRNANTQAAPSGSTAPAQVRTQQGDTAPFVFGSTTTVDRGTTPRRSAASARNAERRSLQVQIRDAQRQYLTLRRAGDPRAEQYRLEMERLKQRERQLNRSGAARTRTASRR